MTRPTDHQAGPRDTRAPERWDLVFVGCGKSKARGKRAALELYTGGVFKSYLAVLKHLDVSPDYILSAKYGLARPQWTLDPYDTTLDNPAYRARWSATILKFLTEYLEERRAAMRGWKDPPLPLEPPRLLVLAGASYIDGWVGDARRIGWIVDDPLRGMSQGDRRGFASFFTKHTPKRSVLDGLGPRPLQLSGAVAEFKADREDAPNQETEELRQQHLYEQLRDALLQEPPPGVTLAQVDTWIKTHTREMQARVRQALQDQERGHYYAVGERWYVDSGFLHALADHHEIVPNRDVWQVLLPGGSLGCRSMGASLHLPGQLGMLYACEARGEIKIPDVLHARAGSASVLGGQWDEWPGGAPLTCACGPSCGCTGCHDEHGHGGHDHNHEEHHGR